MMIARCRCDAMQCDVMVFELRDEGMRKKKKEKAMDG